MKLLALAIILVVAVLAVQVAAGGGDFVPARPADPCATRAQPPAPAQLEPLAERLVLVGLDETACALGRSRERLVLDLAAGERVDPEAIEAGMLRAVDGIDPLPPVSALLPEAMDSSGLPGIVQDAVEAVPDTVVDDLLPTRELLRRAVEELDFAALLDGLDDPDQIEPLLRDAVLAAGSDQIIATVEDLLP